MCHFSFSLLEMFDLETNEHVQKAVHDRQMPKVEYRKIEVDDYGKCCIVPLEQTARPPAGIAVPRGSPPAPHSPASWLEMHPACEGEIRAGLMGESILH